MRKQGQDFAASCLPFNAYNNFLPDRSWEKVHADFKRPIGGKYYLHAVIDQHSEVDLVSSTSLKKLRPILDRIVSTNGIPETLTTDNGPPHSSHEMAEYAKEMGFKFLSVSPEDPQCNSLLENFVNFVQVVTHCFR